MAYIQVEASVRTHKKFLEAGPAPSWLWLCGVGYCQDGLTDGYIPSQALPYLGVKNAAQLAGHLVKAGLWDAVDGGWQIHDYLKHNKASAEVNRIKASRKAGGHLGGRPENLQGKPSSKPSDTQEANLPENPTLLVSATAPDRIVSATATGPPPVKGSSIVKPRRKDAAWEGGRVYVPQRLHSDFIGFRNHPGAENELLAWYATVDDGWTGEIDPEMFRFWTARYAERWPSTKPAARDTQPAWECPHLEPCERRSVCGNKLILGTVKYPVRNAEAS